MNRLIISQVRRLTFAAKSQCFLHTEIDIPLLALSNFPRPYSSAIDAQHIDKGFSKREKKQSTKMITFKDKIEQHDLDSKLTNIRKWLSKGFFVKASIVNASKDEKKVEQFYNDLIKELSKEGKFQMFKTSNRETKFSIEPIVNIETDKKNLT